MNERNRLCMSRKRERSAAEYHKGIIMKNPQYGGYIAAIRGILRSPLAESLTLA
jgi:hypothetical protein